MPVRKEKEQQEEKHIYTYEKLLAHIRRHIDGRLGGVSVFLQSEGYRNLGFEGTPNEIAKMFTYLSLPAEGEKVRVKSYPVLKVLYKELLNIDIGSKIKVVREQILTSNKKI